MVRHHLAGMVALVLRGMVALVGCLGLMASTAASEPQVTRLAAVRTDGPIALGPGPTRLTLTGPDAPGTAIQALGPGRDLYLVFAGLRAAEQPGVVYYVYLAPPATGAPPGPDSPFFVGTLNFFAAGNLGYGGPAGAHPTVSLNVTAVGRELAAKGLLGRQTSLTIVPDGVPAPEAKPSIESVALVAQ